MTDTNLIVEHIAYNMLPKKPSMGIDIIDKSKIIEYLIF